MTDYGHDLMFGAFLTPRADSIERLIQATSEAERVGLDLIAIQDHPYHPGFLDTLTLIGQLAARTTRIRFAGDVLNLPLRPPAVLAKTIATLDLMTGGRVELGIGSGGYWDPIVAYGGRRLTPGQGIEALSEAIDIIRSLWDTSDRSMVRRDGEYYQIVGAKRGPSPAHPVSIWVGGYKPRMLRLIGSQADGWLPSLGMLPLDAVADANRRIDEAALAAGRDPKQIRRLANLSGTVQTTRTADLLTGPVDQWIEQLTGLALDHGFSGFILAGDDTTQYDTIGRDVIPAVRAAVAEGRS